MYRVLLIGGFIAILFLANVSTSKQIRNGAIINDQFTDTSVEELYFQSLLKELKDSICEGTLPGIFFDSCFPCLSHFQNKNILHGDLRERLIDSLPDPFLYRVLSFTDSNKLMYKCNRVTNCPGRRKTNTWELFKRRGKLIELEANKKEFYSLRAEDFVYSQKIKTDGNYIREIKISDTKTIYYSILKFHKNGTLREYDAENNNLKEPDYWEEYRYFYNAENRVLMMENIHFINNKMRHVYKYAKVRDKYIEIYKTIVNGNDISHKIKKLHGKYIYK